MGNIVVYVRNMIMSCSHSVNARSRGGIGKILQKLDTSHSKEYNKEGTIYIIITVGFTGDAKTYLFLEKYPNWILIKPNYLRFPLRNQLRQHMTYCWHFFSPITTHGYIVETRIVWQCWWLSKYEKWKRYPGSIHDHFSTLIIERNRRHFIDAISKCKFLRKN